MAVDVTPSLSDLTNIPSNPELGGAVPNPIIDNSRVVDQLNSDARYHAENTWRKYQQFLQNKTDLFKNISDIQSLDTTPEDRDILNKQAGDIFSDILKDPSIAMGGTGYDQLESKINQFKQSATLSKQNKLDYDANQLFLARNPDLQNEDNNKLQQQFLQTPLGQRKSVQLQLPTVFDEKNTFEGLLKGSTQPYTAVVGADGKPGKGYIETGNEVNPKALSSLWQMALDGEKDKYGHSIMGAVKSNYDALPDDVKSQYDKNGGIKKYFADRGQKYIDAYFPQGSYTQSPEGNYRFGKKLTADPNYLGAEKVAIEQGNLNEKRKYDNARTSIDWAELGLKRDKLNNDNNSTLNDAGSVINKFTDIINNGVPVNVYNQKDGTTTQELRISDPDVLKNFGTIDKDGTVSNEPSAMRFNPKTNQATLIYADNKKTNASNGYGTATKPTREIPLDQRTWMHIATKNTFPNKDIGDVNAVIEKALQANGNSIYNISQKNKPQEQQQQTAPTPKVATPTRAAPTQAVGKKVIKTAKGVSLPVF